MIIWVSLDCWYPVVRITFGGAGLSIIFLFPFATEELVLVRYIWHMPKTFRKSWLQTCAAFPRPPSLIHDLSPPHFRRESLATNGRPAGDVSRARVLVFDQLLRAELARRRNVPRVPAFDYGGRLHGSVQLGKVRKLRCSIVLGWVVLYDFAIRFFFDFFIWNFPNKFPYNCEGRSYKMDLYTMTFSYLKKEFPDRFGQNCRLFFYLTCYDFKLNSQKYLFFLFWKFLIFLGDKKDIICVIVRDVQNVV